MERYLTLVYDSGAAPAFILTKADLEDNISEKVSELESIAFGVPFHVVSSYEEKGIVEELALQCRFSDCTHTSEPGCAVIKAVESGEISQERLDNYFKLKKEIVNTQNKLLHGHKFMEKEKVKNMMGSLSARKKLSNK